MKREDAPPPGWYPDPTGGSQLWWWDGLDWTDHRRAPPNRPMVPVGAPPATDEDRADPDGPTPWARPSTRTSLGRDETTAMLAEVRKVAREEVDRAVERVTDRARDATRRIEPLISQYGDRVLKWIRNIGIVVIVLAVLWMVLQTFGQASLLDWIGDRIDNLTGDEARTAEARSDSTAFSPSSSVAQTMPGAVA